MKNILDVKGNPEFLKKEKKRLKKNFKKLIETNKLKKSVKIEGD